MFNLFSKKVAGFLAYKNGDAIGSGFLQGSVFHLEDGTKIKFNKREMEFFPWDAE
jgi:hypothetical protein